MSSIDYHNLDITKRAEASALWPQLSKQNGDILPYLLERYLLLENWRRDKFEEDELPNYDLAYLHLLLAETVTVLLSQEERIRKLENKS